MAHIRLNAEQWSSLSDEEQSEMIKILKDTGLMREGDEIVPDANAPSAGTPRSSEASAASIDPCIKDCNRMQADALARCSTWPAETRGFCIAFAKEAGDICRSACKEGR